MKKVINGIKIVKNKASLYVNGRMQYQAINLVAEYGTELVLRRAWTSSGHIST